MLEHYGLTLLDQDPEGPIPPRHVALVEMAEADLAAAFARKRVDAVISVIAPTAPAAQRIVGIVQDVEPQPEGRRSWTWRMPTPSWRACHASKW